MADVDVNDDDTDDNIENADDVRKYEYTTLLCNNINNRNSIILLNAFLVM